MRGVRTVGSAAIAEHAVKISKNCAPVSTETRRNFFQPFGLSGNAATEASSMSACDFSSLLVFSSAGTSTTGAGKAVALDAYDCDIAGSIVEQTRG